MNRDDAVTKNLTLIEYYKEQLNSIDYQLQFMQAALSDLHKAKMTLENLSKTSSKNDMIIPIGGGVFVFGSVTDVSKVLLGIGTDLVAEKNMDDAIKKVDERITTAQENQQKIVSLAQKLENELAELSQKTQQMMNEEKE